MARGPQAFKQADVVRTIKAVQTAGSIIVRTEIHTDGRIVLYRQAEAAEAREETYEEWKARTGANAAYPSGGDARNRTFATSSRAVNWSASSLEGS